MSASNPPRSSADRSFASKYGRIHQRYSQALEKLGRTDEALKERRRSEALLAFSPTGSPE